VIRRILAVALFAVLAAVLGAGCTDTPEQSITDIFRDYYAAYNARDWDACLGHIDDATNLGAGAIRSALQQSMAATGAVTLESVDNIQVSGSSATAEVTLTWAGSAGSETLERALVKKSSAWKISYPWD